MALIAGAVGTAYVVGNMFGSSAKLRAQKEAARIINEARLQGMQRSKEYEAEFTPFVEKARRTLDESSGLISKYLSQTEGMGVESGLSESDKIAYEDAAKLLNEQMVSTGNLRSGAAAFGQSNLLRRVVADANERNFGRRVAKLQLLFGGANQLTSVGQTQGQIGLYGKQLSSQLLQAAMGMAPAQASAEIGAGQARAEFAGQAGGGPASLLSFQNAFESSQQDQAYTDYLRAKTKAIS